MRSSITKGNARVCAFQQEKAERTAEARRRQTGYPEAKEQLMTFYGIKFLMVEAAPDGTLIGTPLPGRPRSPEAEAANAYYMLPSGPGLQPPAAGDMIWVELR